MLNLKGLSKKEFNQRVRYQKSLNMLYMNLPKASCTTIKRALFGAVAGESYKNPFQFDQNFKGAFLSYNRIDEDFFSSEKPFTFTFLRNPYSRIFSAYYDKVYGGKKRRPRKIKFVVNKFGQEGDVSFGEFLDWIDSIPDEQRDPHFRSMVGQTLWAKVDFDMVGAIEHQASYEALKSEVRKRSGKAGVSLNFNKLFENMNSTNSANALQDYKKYFPRIYDIYRDDFEALGYSSNIGDILVPPKVMTLKS